MLNKIFVIITYSFLFSAKSTGQQFVSDSLWGKITYICDSSNYTTSEKLKLLIKIESGVDQLSDRQDSSWELLLRNIGLLYSSLGDYLKGVQYLKKDIDMLNSNIGKPWINAGHLVICYYKLNVFYDSLKRIPEEIKALDSCFTIARRLKTINLYCLAALYKKIEILFDLGDYSNCISYAIICEMLGKQYSQGAGETDYVDGMGYAFSSLLWNVNAQLTLKNYDIAESLLKGKLEEQKKTRQTFNLGTLYEQLAEVQVAKGNFKNALINFNKAFAAEYKEGNIIGCKGIQNNIGIFHLKQEHKTELALLCFRKALALVNKNKLLDELSSIETLNILANIGDVYVQMNLYDSAFAYFQYALDQIRQGISDTELLNSRYNEFERQKKIGYLTSLLLDKGDAFQKFYESTGELSAVQEAIRIYKLTDQLLDRIKMEQSDMQSKLFWRSDSRRLYEHAIEACYVNNNMNDAFYFFEKSRAVLLNDELNEQRWLGEEDIQKQTQIKKEILKLKNEIDGPNGDSGQIEILQNKLFNSKQELSHLVQTIKDRDPLYYQSFIDLEVNSVQDVRRNLLSDHQGLVEIFSGDSAVYIFKISNLKTEFTKVDKFIFDSLSTAYLTFISNVSLLNSRFNEFIGISNRLYKLIFRDEMIPQGRIIISPDGKYFPFEALVTSNMSEPLNYFLNNYAVCYTYSAKYMMNLFVSKLGDYSHAFLGVAPVKYPSGMRLAALIGSDQSISRVKSYFAESMSLLFTDATKAGFMDRFSNYRVIQLYTHAVDSGKNGEPVIYFADSALYLSELMEENKPVTRLVVLSACETGNGKLYKGEGVFSFNRGFAAIGIPSSITNLWSVDNQSTYKLTELFYKYLAMGMPIDLALQKAKIEFTKTASKFNQLPYFWAASILVGNNDEIDLKKTSSAKTILIMLIASGFIFVLTILGFKTFKKNILL
jgi:tetratricopeptide (TPR) repeat protein